MSIFTVLRPIAGVHRELRRLNDAVEAIMIHFEIKPLKQLREEAALAAKEQKLREELDALGRRHPDDINTSSLTLALEELRARERRGEAISDAEILAASRAIEDAAALDRGGPGSEEY